VLTTWLRLEQALVDNKLAGARFDS
jgi:hypothetical protein